MPYTNPTPADVKLDFPAFATVDDAIIQRRIDRASMWVDESWLETDYTYAKELVAARYLERDGYPAGASGGGVGSMVGITSIKSGAFSATQTAEAANASLGAFWSGSAYASEWLALLAKNKGGPRVAHGGGCGIGPSSTDVPFAWRYGGFAL